jgi:predicted RNase H-like HicB family nuclease
MTSMNTVRAVIYQDRESGEWYWSLLELRGIGGGQPSRDEAIADCQEALGLIVNDTLSHGADYRRGNYRDERFEAEQAGTLIEFHITPHAVA